MMTKDETSSEWRDIADQLTPEQILEMKEHEAMTPGETKYLLVNAREYAEDNVRSAVMFPGVVRPPDAIGPLGSWFERSGAWMREFDGTCREHRRFSITVAGRQHADGTVARYARVVGYDPDEFTVDDVRRIADLIVETVGELDRLDPPSI